VYFSFFFLMFSKQSTLRVGCFANTNEMNIMEKVPRMKVWQLLQEIYKTCQLSDYEKAWAFLIVIKKIDTDGSIEQAFKTMASKPSIQAIGNGATDEKLDLMLADAMSHVRPDVQGREEEAALLSIAFICRDKIQQTNAPVDKAIECTGLVLEFINRIIESKHLDEKVNR
jgi:hypothetical protein